MKPALQTLLLTLAMASWAGQASGQSSWLQGAYKDATQHLDPQTLRMRSKIAAAPAQTLPEPKGFGDTLVWAFATGECGQERWGDFDTDRFAAANRAAFSVARANYIVATGGEAGIFTCTTRAGMQRFLARYDSPQLVGLDFDIEGKQTAAQIDALVRQVAALARQRPKLRMSFTVATHASPDGSLRSLNATGERVLTSLRRHRLRSAVLNLMVMNYGPADTRWCVLTQGDGAPRCAMGPSALQAARNVHAKYQWPLSQIALTPMLGENDVDGNRFMPQDAQDVVAGARQLGLAGVHHWSLDRDQPCPAGSPRVSPQCHGLNTLAPRAFAAALGETPGGASAGATPQAGTAPK